VGKSRKIIFMWLGTKENMEIF
jgi:hypothetical protein